MNLDNMQYRFLLNKKIRHSLGGLPFSSAHYKVFNEAFTDSFDNRHCSRSTKQYDQSCSSYRALIQNEQSSIEVLEQKESFRWGYYTLFQKGTTRALFYILYKNYYIYYILPFSLSQIKEKGRYRLRVLLRIEQDVSTPYY